MNPMDRLLRLAEVQHGVFSRDDARRLQVHRNVLARAVDRDLIERRGSRVFRVVGSVETAEQLLLAAVLDAGPGAVASHASAAWLWRLPGFDDLRLEVTQPRERNRRLVTEAEVHRPLRVPAHHVTVQRAIPTTSLPLTLVDCAGFLRPRRTVRVCDSVLARHDRLLPALHRVVDEVGTRGKPGTKVMRRILRARPVGRRLPESNTERRTNAILAAAGERPLTPQVDVGGAEWIGRTDLADLDLLVLVEVQSRLFHSSLSDVLADEARFARMRAAGFLEVVPVWEDQVWCRPAEVVTAVREARARARTARSRDDRATRTVRIHPEDDVGGERRAG